MDKINKLSLPATILIGCFILGCFYYASQISKQNFQEKQAKEVRGVELEKNTLLNTCLESAQQYRDNSVKYWTEWSNKTCIGTNNYYVNKCLDAVLLEVSKADSKQKEEEDKCIKLYKS